MRNETPASKPPKTKATPDARAIAALAKAADAAVRRAPTSLDMRLAYAETLKEMSETIATMGAQVWGGPIPPATEDL